MIFIARTEADSLRVWSTVDSDSPQIPLIMSLRQNIHFRPMSHPMIKMLRGYPQVVTSHFLVASTWLLSAKRTWRMSLSNLVPDSCSKFTTGRLFLAENEQIERKFRKGCLSSSTRVLCWWSCSFGQCVVKIICCHQMVILQSACIFPRVLEPEGDSED